MSIKKNDVSSGNSTGNVDGMNKAQSEARPVIDELKKLLKKSDDSDSLSAKQSKPRLKTAEGGSISK